MSQTFPPEGNDTPPPNSGTKFNIPREFVPLLDAYAVSSDEYIELWTYAIVLLMIDEEQVRMVGMHELAGREWVMLQIYGGEEFEIVKPNLTEAQERHFIRGVRRIVEGV